MEARSEDQVVVVVFGSSVEGKGAPGREQGGECSEHRAKRSFGFPSRERKVPAAPAVLRQPRPTWPLLQTTE